MFSSKKMKLAATGFATLAIAAFSGSAFAAQIHTGGARGAYNGDFCPPLAASLGKAKFDYKCTLSRGSNENIDRVRDNPTDIGLSQLDVFAKAAQKAYPRQPFHAIRTDIARECLFMVTKNRDLKNLGDVAVQAENLNFVLPPVGSGSASTFDFLRSIDPDGLGRATNVDHAESTDLALKRALSSDDNTVALFVQFPDPDNDRFKMITKEKGHFIPVIDRNILRQQVGDQKVYYAQETEVSNAKFWKKGVKVTTACTPLVIFTGNPEALPEGNERLDHRDMINTINDMPAQALLPKKNFFKKAWAKTKALSAGATEKMLDATDKAREKAGPLWEKTKEKARELGDKAKPMYDKAKEKAIEYGEKAYDKAKDLGDAAREQMNR